MCQWQKQRREGTCRDAAQISTGVSKTSEREESEKCHHCCEPVGHGVVLELSASTGKGGGWEGFEG